MKFVFHIKYQFIAITTLLFLLSSNFSNSQTNNNQNIILKGKISNKEKNVLCKNTSISVLGFNKQRIIKTNNEGEYEVNFNDHTGDTLTENWNFKEGEILFVSNDDPNISQTIILDDNRIKKARRGKKDKDPAIIKLDIVLKFEFE